MYLSILSMVSCLFLDQQELSSFLTENKFNQIEIINYTGSFHNELSIFLVTNGNFDAPDTTDPHAFSKTQLSLPKRP